MKKIYSLKARLWKYDGPAGWVFVTLPKTLAKKIRTQHSASEEGWGRLKVNARIGQTSWATAIWFDTKAQSYLLPLKLDVRKKEKLVIGELTTVELAIALEPHQRRLRREE